MYNVPVAINLTCITTDERTTAWIQIQPCETSRYQMASKRAKQLVHVSLRREDRSRMQDEDRSRRASVSKSEFSRQFDKCRKGGAHIYLDQFGRCYVPASSERLRELDVENDLDVQQLGLSVMFVDNESGRSSSMVAVSERRMLLIPGDAVELRTVVTKRSVPQSTYTDDRMKEMSVFAVLGHGRSRCFIVYLQDIST